MRAIGVFIALVISVFAIIGMTLGAGLMSFLESIFCGDEKR